MPIRSSSGRSALRSFWSKKMRNWPRGSVSAPITTTATMVTTTITMDTVMTMTRGRGHDNDHGHGRLVPVAAGIKIKHVWRCGTFPHRRIFSSLASPAGYQADAFCVESILWPYAFSPALRAAQSSPVAPIPIWPNQPKKVAKRRWSRPAPWRRRCPRTISPAILPSAICTRRMVEAGNGEFDECLEAAARATEEVKERRHTLQPGEKLKVLQSNE